MPDVPWWNSAVIYEIYPRSFQDTNADGVGDLRGIIARLPYLVDLGVDAIWICPIFPSPMLQDTDQAGSSGPGSAPQIGRSC